MREREREKLKSKYGEKSKRKKGEVPVHVIVSKQQNKHFTCKTTYTCIRTLNGSIMVTLTIAISSTDPSSECLLLPPPVDEVPSPEAGV